MNRRVCLVALLCFSVQALLIFAGLSFTKESITVTPATGATRDPQQSSAVSCVSPSFAVKPPISWAAPTPPPVKCTARLMPIATAALCRQREFNMSTLSVASSATSLEPPEDALSYCELALLHTDSCKREEYATECVRRLGPAKLQRWLARRCTTSEWFENLWNRSNANSLSGRTTAASAAASGNTDAPEEPLGGAIVSSMIDSGVVQPYVPPEERPKGHVIPWRASPYLPCEYNRLNIAIPAENIVQRVERDKLFDVYPLVPQRFPLKAAYAFGSNDEAVLREAQRRSYFTTTHRRGCWTAQRHYDGLASGSVPLFIDLHLSAEPEVDLPMYPVDLLMEARRLLGVRHNFVGSTTSEENHPNFVDEPLQYDGHPVYNIRALPTIDWSVFDQDAYFRLADRLLEYTKANLTTIAVATHFLRALNKENARRVLIFHHYFLPEMASLLHGLAALGIEVYSNSVHHHTKFPHGTTEIEASAERQKHIWLGYRSSGHAFMFRNPRSHMKNCRENVCLRMIQQHAFDIVVYSVSQGISTSSFADDTHHYTHFDEVLQHYMRDEVVFIDGADSARSLSNVAELACRVGRIFSRERPRH